MGGLIDAAIDNQIRKRLSPDHFIAMIEEMVAFGNSKTDGTCVEKVFDLIDDFAHEQIGAIAEFLSRATIALATGERQSDGMAATLPSPDNLLLKVIRFRLVNHLRRECHATRSSAKIAVASLPDERVLDSCHGTTGASLCNGMADPADWLPTIWKFVSEHWVQILGALLPLLLMLI